MIARIVQILAFVLIAGCGGGGGSPETPSRFLYVDADGGPNEFPTATFGFSVFSGGALKPVPGFSPIPALVGGPLVVTDDSKLLYAPSASGLAAFQINPDGSLTSAPSPSFSMTDTPVGLVAHPTADFLYSSSSSGVLSVFAINSGTGALNLTSSVSVGGTNIIQIVNSAVITPDGKYLYQAAWYYPNGFGQPALNQLAVFSIDSATGALSAVPGNPFSTMISPLGFMTIDPTGKFLYASNPLEKEVAAFSINATSGTLTAVPGSPFSLGGNPTSVAIDSSGEFLIVSIEPGALGNCLDVLSIDSGTGTLALVPGSPFGPAALYCGFVAADPSEPLVYAGTGGGQAGPGTPPAIVFALSVDPATGALAPVGQAAVPDGLKVNVDFIATTH
jgi:6-phosphogluconolactonase